MPDILRDRSVELDLESAIANIKRKGTPQIGYFILSMDLNLVSRLLYVTDLTCVNV